MVYPWNFIEDMVDLVTRVMGTESRSLDEIRHLLAEHHEIDQISMEIAQPNRMDEVLIEMERRGVVEAAGEDEWRLAEAAA